MEKIVPLRQHEAPHAKEQTVPFTFQILKLEDRLALYIVEDTNQPVTLYPLTPRCSIACIGHGGPAHDIGLAVREATPIIRSMADRNESSVHSLVYASFMRDLAHHDRTDETVRALENRPYHISVGYNRLLLWAGKYLNLPIPPDLIRVMLAYEA